ncbi:MAG: DUF58 domain-containing protein [Deltaproteobacteria bacterium]|nr:DUF58 domain-containing protein [Deltaproteobacteria bacterium]
MRLFSLIRRIFDLFPWTPLGLLIAGASAVTLKLFAYAELDLVLLVVGYTTLALCVVSAIFVSAAAVFLKLHVRSSEPRQTLVLETKTAMETGFSIPSLFFVPLIQVRWGWEEPKVVRITRSRRRGRLHEVASFSDRGCFRVAVRRLVVEDAFGFCRIAIRVADQIALDVLPHLGGLRHLAALMSMTGGDELPHPMGIDAGDRLELKRYMAGDPARFIHWKVFARTRKLMIRAPERALTLSHRTAAFIVSGPDDDASAAVARLAIEKRLLGSDWSFGSDADIDGAGEIGEALAILMRSSGARGQNAGGIRAFLRRVEEQGPSSLIVFLPPRLSAWIEPILELAKTRRVHAVIGIDGMSIGKREPRWRRLISLPAPQVGTPAEQLQQTVQALKKGKCQITVLDRVSGRAIGEQHWRAGATISIVPVRFGFSPTDH